MNFSQFMNSLYAATGAGESKVLFFKTFFNEVVDSQITEFVYPEDDTIRKYFRGERSPLKFFQNLGEVTSEAIEEYLSDILLDRDAVQRFIAYCNGKDIRFNVKIPNLPHALTNEFKNIYQEVLYGNDDKARTRIKSILTKIRLQWGFLCSTGMEIAKIPKSPYRPYLMDAETFEPKKKLGNYFDDFQSWNEKLIPYIADYPKMERLYQLSLEIQKEDFENIFNIPACHTEYCELLNDLISQY